MRREKKVERPKIVKISKYHSRDDGNYREGFNQALSDYEAYLMSKAIRSRFVVPRKVEMREIYPIVQEHWPCDAKDCLGCMKVAEAITNHLNGEREE